MPRMTKRAIFWTVLALIALTAAGFGAFWALTAPEPVSGTLLGRLYDAGDPVRGERIFLAADCSSCHASPGQKDRLRLGGGMALASPFGTFRPPNISPDPVSGIGAWTVADLADALLAGVSPAGQHYYPAFPYPSYTGMRVDDVRNLFAYLRTLPAVAGRPPEHALSFPLNIRRFVGLWKLLYFDGDRTRTTPAAETPLERGRYLVESVAHCDECHSTRNLFGAIRPETKFAGGVDPSGTGFIPNITPERIGDWSVAEIAELLRSGRTPGGRVVGSSMADVVANTARLPPADRAAMALYIAGLPARPTPSP